MEPAAARDLAGLLELGRQRLDERCRRLLPQAEPLSRGTERDEPAVGAFLASGGAGERCLDAATLGAQLGEARLGSCGETALVHRNASVRMARALGRLAVGLGRVARRRRRRAGGILEDAHGLVAAVGRRTLGLGEIAAQSLLELGRRLASQHEPLGGSLQAVEGTERRLAPAGGVGQLVLGLLALLEQGSELLLRTATRDHDCIAAGFCVGPAVGHGEQVELSDPRPQRRDLDRELLGPLGGGRLKRERPQPLAHLLLDVLRALDLDPDPSELSSARCLRRLNLPSPAASSTRWRLSSGFEASTASTLPCETIECIEPPRPTSARSSTRSVRRTAALLTRYWPSPPRTSRRVIAISL